MNATKPYHRWFAYSLRTLLIAIAALAVAISCLLHSARAQRDAVTALRSAGATVEYDYELDAKGQASTKRSPEGPPWITDLLGVDFSNTAVGVWIYGTNAPLTDDLIERIGRLKGLRRLGLVNVGLRDDSLKHFVALEHLEMLSLEGNALSGHGLAYFANSPQLTHMALAQNQLTDQGLEQLSALSSLKVLDISGNKITASGLASLAKLPNLVDLSVDLRPETPENMKALRCLLDALPNLRLRARR